MNRVILRLAILLLVSAVSGCSAQPSLSSKPDKFVLYLGEIEILRLRVVDQFGPYAVSDWAAGGIFPFGVGGGHSESGMKEYTQVRFYVRIADGRIAPMTEELDRLVLRYGDEPSMQIVPQIRGGSRARWYWDRRTVILPQDLIKYIAYSYVLTIPEGSEADFLQTLPGMAR